jgi:hypothetical protein
VAGTGPEVLISLVLVSSVFLFLSVSLSVTLSLFHSNSMPDTRVPVDEGDMIAISEKSSVVEETGYGSGSERAKEEGLEVYTPADEKKSDEAPNGGKGWVMIACVATING